jgi:hypothetical protein
MEFLRLVLGTTKYIINP